MSGALVFIDYTTKGNRWVSSNDPLPVTGGGTVSAPSVVVGNVASGAADSGDAVKIGGVYSSALPTFTNGQRANVQVSNKGVLLSSISDGTSNVIASLSVAGADGSSNSQVALNTYSRVSRYNGTSWDRNRKPNATSRIPSSANSTNATSAKATAGDLCNVNGYNSSATVTYLKFYNKATAPTVGTDVPVLTIPLPPLLAFSYSLDSFYFSTGIAYGLTTDAADAGTTAVAAGAILGLNVVYA